MTLAVTTRRLRKLLSPQGPALAWSLLLGWARRRRGYEPDLFARSFDEVAGYIDQGSVLGSYFAGHKGRLLIKWLHYVPAYDAELSPYLKGFPLPEGHRRPMRVLELGSAHGGALQLWRRYFGPEAAIWGIDVNPSSLIDEPGLNIRIGSQADPEFLRSVVTEMGGVDLVIDDGSHVAKHQEVSLEVLFPLLSDGGLYVVEDTHTSYWWDYGGRYRSRRSFLAQTKSLIDDMHGWYHGQGQSSPLEAQRWIPKLTIYDSMVFIKKEARRKPTLVEFGRRSF